MADIHCNNEISKSVSDEERVRKLFQACDTNGDGFIDSQDMLAICQQLSLEDSIDELMEQLGADSQGRISYENFLQRRVALKPEIEALRSSKNDDNVSEDSQGKLDSWEWDSGARDMSPIPKFFAKKAVDVSECRKDLNERFTHQLEEQAQRYEEQLTELHSVIAELTKKLDQQSSMAIVEEDEVSEVDTSVREDSVSCSLDITEYDPQGSENASEFETKLDKKTSVMADHKFNNTPACDTSDGFSPTTDLLQSLQQEIIDLKAQLVEAQSQLTQKSYDNFNVMEGKNIDLSPESHFQVDCNSKICAETKFNVKYSNIVPIQKTNTSNCPSFNCAPVTKIAERIKLKLATDGKTEVNCGAVVGTDLPTVIAEHIVGDILKQPDDYNEKKWIDLELKKLSTKIEHTKSQNYVLAITLSETKAHCDRLALLCGKYESNALALRLALGVTDRIIEAYDVLLALLETELAVDDSKPEAIENRIAAESVAQQLLNHLESYQSADLLLSPWQNHGLANLTLEHKDPWSPEKEIKLREHVSRLKGERSGIQGTYVTLESPQIEGSSTKPLLPSEAAKIDLEMAVLMQELMSLREDKAELLSKVFVLEKDRNSIKLKLTYMEGQQKAQGIVLKNLQEQLKDTENLLSLATQRHERLYSDQEHIQTVELELVQALARESRLKIRLQELVSSLQQVTQNAETRLSEGREMMQDLNHTNSVLSDTLDKNHRKYQSTLKKMEQQMLEMVQQHNLQVRTLQQRITLLETPSSNSLKT